MKFDLFELEFVDKDRNIVTTDEWLAGKQGTWELKHRILGTIALFVIAIVLLPVILLAFAILSIENIPCMHKKALLGMLDKKTKKEQHYCSVCNKIYLKKGRQA